MNIMVIDDELISRKKLGEILSQFGNIKEFDRGDMAILHYQQRLLEKEKIDLITVDITMPLLNGILVLHKLRDLEQQFNVSEEKKAVIMMVTSSSSKQEVLQSLSQGANEYILKPFNEASIMERLKRYNLAS